MSAHQSVMYMTIFHRCNFPGIHTHCAAQKQHCAEWYLLKSELVWRWDFSPAHNGAKAPSPGEEKRGAVPNGFYSA